MVTNWLPWQHLAIKIDENETHSYKVYEKPPSFMIGKITSNSKSLQKNIGGGKNPPPTSMSRVKDLLFALTSLLTRNLLLWMLTASNCKSTYTKYLNVYLKLVTTSTFGYFLSLWFWSVFLLEFVQFILKLSFKKIDLVNIVQFNVESLMLLYFCQKRIRAFIGT